MYNGGRHFKPAKLERRALMQVDVSRFLLAAAVFVILWPGYDGAIKHWAFATAGTILGYWLRP